ncbi:MAG: hypothetical protein ABJA89_11680 [Lapillicoccus sp.]
MGTWFDDAILEPGRLPLFCFFVLFLLTFVFIRFSVRMIRAQVSWWPGNITPGGLHIHHVVFGTVTMVVGGVAGLAVPHDPVVWPALSASAFGIGTALVLDEFAMILHLDDVYWAETGRLSVDAVFVAAALTGLVLLGGIPAVDDVASLRTLGVYYIPGIILVLVVNFSLAAITLVKGKIWTGLIGLFIPFLLLVGAIRLARPASIWARHWYTDRPHKRERAELREQRYRVPAQRLKVWFQDAIAGAPDRA